MTNWLMPSSPFWDILSVLWDMASGAGKPGQYAETETDANGAFTLRATGGLWMIFVMGGGWVRDFLYQPLDDVVLSDGGASQALLSYRV